MTEYQERRLNILNNRIEFQENHKRFFIRNYRTIILFTLFGSAAIVALGFINDPKRIKSPETYDYSGLIWLTLSVFAGILLMIAIVHVLVTIQSNSIIKKLEKEEKTLLDIIEKNRLDFERFENFDEIGDEE